MINSNNKGIAIWLLCGCFLIFCMVVIGGITRLTGSGLSITEWTPIMGTIPPLNNEEWQIAFQKYQQIPQFQKINYNFQLEDFKSIFWWEFIHRLLGRFIGIAFIVPFLWFYFKGRFDKSTLKKVLFLFFLGGLQGVIGWLMVKSGLSERTSVSHIRLSLHLITAFFTFGFTLYFALEILLEKINSSSEKITHRLINILFSTVTIQIIYGAFVAGLHAGNIYNTFPLMNGKIIPEGLFYLDPAWINFFDNQVLVQFIHRFLAGTIVLLSGFIFYPLLKSSINSYQKKGILFFLSVLCLQIILGIATLLTSVNITLAVLHQAAAFVLFSASVFLIYIFRAGRLTQGLK